MKETQNERKRTTRLPPGLIIPGGGERERDKIPVAAAKMVTPLPESTTHPAPTPSRPAHLHLALNPANTEPPPGDLGDTNVESAPVDTPMQRPPLDTAIHQHHPSLNATPATVRHHEHEHVIPPQRESTPTDVSTNTPRRPTDTRYANGWLESHPNADSQGPPDVKYPRGGLVVPTGDTTSHLPMLYPSTGPPPNANYPQAASRPMLYPSTAPPPDAKYPETASRLTLYIGNLPRPSEEVRQILHKFLISLGLDGYEIVNLQPCLHKKDKRQFAEIRVGTEADRAKLLAKNYAFLFNRFIMVGPKNDLITGANGKVCRTCGWNYMAPDHAKESKAFKYLCAECLRSRKILEEMKSRVSVDFRWKKEDIIAVLERNHIHAHNIHRRLYLEDCPRKVCRKMGCNFAHNRRQQYLGEVVNEFRKIGIDEDLASMPISRRRGRSLSRSASPVRGHPPGEQIINGLKPSWVSGLPDHPAPRRSRRSARSASVDSGHRKMTPGSRRSRASLRGALRESLSSSNSLFVQTGSPGMAARLGRDPLSDMPDAKRRRVPIDNNLESGSFLFLDPIRRSPRRGSNGMRNRTIDNTSHDTRTSSSPSPAGILIPPTDTGLSPDARRRRRKLSRSRGRSTSPGNRGLSNKRGILNLEKALQRSTRG